MSLVFADGFDHYFAADILRKWTGLMASTAQSEVFIAPEYARPPSGMGYKCIQGAGASRGIYKTLSTTHTSFVVGFAVYFSNGVPTGATAPFWAGYDSGTSIGTTHQIALRCDAGGHLVVANGSNAGTVLTTSANIFSANTWYHIELKATINNTTGTYEVRVNGSSVGWIPAQTGKNTRGQSANNYIDAFGLLTAASNGLWIDDFYFLSSAAPNNDFLGPIKIMTAYPSGAGNYAQWTGNFASNFTNVQELAADGDNTFNQSATAAQIDTFSFDDLPVGTIVAVQDVMVARQDAGAARTVRTKFRSGSDDDDGSSFVMAGSHQVFLDPHDVDPATGSAYTVTDFNAQERGYELVS